MKPFQIKRDAARGQSLVEYTLIIVLVVIAIALALTLVPLENAISNVFDDAIAGVMNGTVTPRSTLSETEFWRLVTEVASITPQTRVAATNTVPAGAQPTFTPTRLPTNTPEPTVTGTPPTPTNTPTQRPPATPSDQEYSYPFYDAGDRLGAWHIGFTNVINQTALWTVEYFNGPTDANWFPGIPAATEYLFWPQDINRTWAGVPNGSIINPDNWSVRYTATIPLEDFRYQIRLTSKSRARIIINGVTVAQITEDTGSVERSVVADYAGTAGTADVRIEMRDTAGEASIGVIFNRLADRGTCDWQLTNIQPHSPPSQYTDSMGNYTVDSDCHLRLRGFINIPASATPRLVFWERWALSTQDTTYVGLREYNDSNEPWVWVAVNTGANSNMNWKRRVYNLMNFGGRDWRGKRIELAFRVESIDANVADGWYIDDIAIEDNTTRLYTIGFSDPADNPAISLPNWLNECTWQLTTTKKYSGASAWGSNPGTNYQNNADCALTLNGLVDLTGYPAGSPTSLELSFYSDATLASVTDRAVVEWAPEGSSTWTAMTPFGSSNPYVAQATTAPWRQVSIRLNELKGTRFQLRFRLISDNDGNVAAGWFIDNIELRERATAVLGLPFDEPFNDTSRWLLGGAWGLTTGASAPQRSAPSALSDSPGVGVSYSVPSDTTAELNPSINLIGSSKPVLSFWVYWQASSANLYAEISTDDGETWVPVWRKLVGGSDYDDVPVQLAWQRVKVDLSAYTSNIVRFRFRLQAPGGIPDDGWYIDDLRIAEEDTNVYALSAGPLLESFENEDAILEWFNGGSWRITNEHGRNNTKAWSDSPAANYAKPSRSVLEPRYGIDLRGTTKPTLYFWTRFDLNSNDRLLVEASRDNGYTWPDVLWDNSSAGVSEWVNLGWHRIQLDLTPFIQTQPTDPPLRLRFRLQALNTAPSADGWYIDDFTLYDRAFMPDLGQNFADSFNDFRNWIVEGNWTIVPDQYSAWEYQPAAFVPQPLLLSGMSEPTTNWIGDYWHTPPPTASGQTDRVAIWGWPAGTNVNIPTTPPNIPRDTAVGEINFDYSQDLTQLPYPDAVTQWFVSGLANHEWYIMRWQRRYRVTQPGEYMLRLRFAGGARLFINNVEQTPRGDLTKPYWTVGAIATQPWTVDPDLRSHFYTYNFSSGVDYDIRIEYYHTTTAQSGDGRIEFSISERSSIARTSPFGQPYSTFHRTSIILNGYLNIPAGKVGNVRYDERFSFTDEDYGKVYYSLDEGFTWMEVTPMRRSNNNPQGGSWSIGSLQDWIDTSFLITEPGGGQFTAPQRALIKFELDSRTNPAVDDGWWIDNFQFTATDAIANMPPSFTNAVLNTVTNTPGAVVPNVVDQPGDTHTFTVLTQPVRGVAGVSAGGSQLIYQPPNEWTGTVSFTYRATDQGGLSRIGTAVVNVRPFFFRGVNVGTSSSTAVTINGNPWVSHDGNVTTGNTNGINTGTLAITPPQDTDTTTMLRSHRQAQTSSNARVTLTNVPTGVYTLFVWTVESGTPSQTFDLILEGTTGVRVLNDFSTGSPGSFRRHGPYTVKVTDTTLDVHFPGSSGRQGRIAGLEIWRGADPDIWASGDIRGIETTGKGVTTVINSSTVVMTASGQDIWGTKDEFRYTWRFETGDLDLIGRVAFSSVSSSDWNKVGLMIRDSERANSRHFSIFFTSERRASAQRRLSNGADSQSNSVDNVSVSTSVPIWVRISKTGNNFTAFYANDGVNWTQVGPTETITMGSYFMIGLALTSHLDGQFATATIDNIQIIRR
ncbi:MAG: PA14 domain-containing protein [Aggregatilineales bacterium]